MANTVFEGGYYLVFVWLAFRVAVIGLCFSAVQTLRSKALLVPASLLFGFVTFNGVLGTLGIQPPLYLWWAIAVGGILLFVESEVRLRALKKDRPDRSETAGRETTENAKQKSRI